MRVNAFEVPGASPTGVEWRPLLFRAFEVWMVIAAAESLHGIARTSFLSPVVGDFRARQIAVFSGSLIIVTVALVFCRWMEARTIVEQLAAGGLWVALTVAFELGLGRLATGFTWDRILSDYNLPEGGLLPLGLLVMLLAPAIAARVPAARQRS